jgi:predicted O-methyltransferase YrrM
MTGSQLPIDSASELDRLPATFAQGLRSMYANEPQASEDGALHDMQYAARISMDEGLWIFDACVGRQARRTLEIGLAYGFSTMYFLAAHHANGGGTHTAVDPWARKGRWQGLGYAKAKLTGMHDSFRFIEKKSAVGLAQLVEAKERFDVIFIDGSHLFDSVMTDFSLAALLCARGGILVFDDTWMPALQKTISFIRANRSDFSPVETPVENIAVFERVGKDERDWAHFADF